MQNHQLNLSYFSQKVEKRSSPIEGRGLFAKRAIKMGEVMVVKGGYVLTRTQRDRIAENSGHLKFKLPRISLSARRPNVSVKAA